MARNLLSLIKTIFDRQAEKHGASPQSVFWKHQEGQDLRYEIMLGIVAREDLAGNITLNDLGCGYGVFFDLIQNTPLMEGSRYTGYDLSEGMIKLAQKRISDARASFIVADHATETADYSFVSGTFNLHGGQDVIEWKHQIATGLTRLWHSTEKGMAFNMLDRNHTNKMDGLYYADANEFMDFCKNTLSENVELIADYPLEEWTIFVRR